MLNIAVVYALTSSSGIFSTSESSAVHYRVFIDFLRETIDVILRYLRNLQLSASCIVADEGKKKKARYSFIFMRLYCLMFMKSYNLKIQCAVAAHT